MKVGLCLPAMDVSTGRPTSLAELTDHAQRAERLGFDSIWLMDHIWAEIDGGRWGAHDPLISLSFIAAKTSRIQLGTLVLCNAFRHPGQLSRELAALADASGSRFICGLGSGWYQPEYDAFGLMFDHRVSRLAETVEVLKPLLRGNRVTHTGRFYQFNDASILTSTPATPIWIGARQPRMLDLVARHADGWNDAWHAESTDLFKARLAGLRQAMSAAARPLEEVEISVGLLVLPEAGADGKAGRAIVGGPEKVAGTLQTYAQAGVQHAIVSVSLIPFTQLKSSYPEALAEGVRLFRNM